MADYVFDPNAIKRISGGEPRVVTWGEAILAGEAVYRDRSGSTDEWLRTVATDADKPKEDGEFGMALSGGGAGQTGTVLIQGVVEVGAGAWAATDLLIVSENAGKLAPYSDLAPTWLLSVFGYFRSATEIQLSNIITNVAKA